MNHWSHFSALHAVQSSMRFLAAIHCSTLDILSEIFTPEVSAFKVTPPITVIRVCVWSCQAHFQEIWAVGYVLTSPLMYQIALFQILLICPSPVAEPLTAKLCTSTITCALSYRKSHGHTQSSSYISALITSGRLSTVYLHYFVLWHLLKWHLHP